MRAFQPKNCPGPHTPETGEMAELSLYCSEPACNSNSFSKRETKTRRTFSKADSPLFYMLFHNPNQICTKYSVGSLCFTKFHENCLDSFCVNLLVNGD